MAGYQGLSFETQRMIRDGIDFIKKRKIKQDDLEQRRLEAAQEAAGVPLRLKQMEIESEKDKEITRRGDAATADLERGRAISNVMSGHLSPTEYSMRYGQALPASGGGSSRSGNALGQATVKPGDTLDANVEALKMANSSYDKIATAALVNPTAIPVDAMDPATGKLMPRDKYIENSYKNTQALLGAGGQNAEETLAGIRAKENFHDAAEALNVRENTVLSKVDENGAPIGANEKGFTKYSLTGVDDAGMPVLNPNGAPPENSIIRQGLSPKSDAIKTASGNTTKVLEIPKSTLHVPAIPTPAPPAEPYSIPGWIKQGVKAIPGLAKNFYNHQALPFAQAMSQTYLGNPNPALLDNLLGSETGDSVRKNLIEGGSAETSALTAPTALRKKATAPVEPYVAPEKLAEADDILKEHNARVARAGTPQNKRIGGINWLKILRRN